LDTVESLNIAGSSGIVVGLCMAEELHIVEEVDIAVGHNSICIRVEHSVAVELHWRELGRELFRHGRRVQKPSVGLYPSVTGFFDTAGEPAMQMFWP
jgi:hypothetical protein